MSPAPAKSIEQFDDRLSERLIDRFSITSKAEASDNLSLNEVEELLVAEYDPESPQLESITISGELSDNPRFQEVANTGQLQSVVARIRGDSLIQFTVDGESLRVEEIEGGKPVRGSPEWETIYLFGQLFLYVTWSVDQFIEQNGLRPVVDEIKKRRWVLMLTATLFIALTN